MHGLPRFASPSTTAVAIVIVAALACPLAGCAGKPSAPAEQVGPEGRLTSAAPVEAMEADSKRSEIDSGFPLEVPVAAGEVVRGEGQGPDAWDYELIVPSTPQAVTDWYGQSYTSRGWSATGQRALQGGGWELTLRKGGAESRVTVTPDGQGARVVVVLGVGAPVLQTQ